MKKLTLLIVGICLIQVAAFAQSNPLIERVTKKLNLVNDYVATGVMKTDVAFIKASLGKVKVYFKKPNLLKVK
jgi:outer membrane lipoprotein-sorting protein